MICVACLSDASSDDYLALGEERIASNEAQISQQMVGLIKTISEQRYQSGKLKRFNQAKSLGCFEADFYVDDNLPDNLRKGLFNQSGMHKAMVRFANASETDDRKKDLRGMSIKVLDVEGKSLWGEDGAQDFVLNSYPALFAANPQDFLDFIEATENDRIWWYFLNPLNSHLKSLWVLFKARKKHSNPFALRYWSTTPYRFGLDESAAVKYSVKSCSNNIREQNTRLHENYLRDAMQTYLQNSPACFDFMVQVQKDPRSMPIENAQVIWDENQSPFLKVATLTIANQDFASSQSLEACENLSFNPWQSLVEHQPLGGINRVRKHIYTEMAEYRRRINHQRMVSVSANPKQ
ncbi:catalase family protein [Kaarinaea lacus]